MKIKSLFFMMGVALLASCTSSKVESLQLTNPFGEAVEGKVVVVKRSEVEKLLGGTLNDQKGILVTNAKGTILASQCDDMDGNGKWDEIAFVSDFDAGATHNFVFSEVDSSEMPEFPIRTSIRFARQNAPYESAASDQRLKSVDSPTISAIFQMEGPAWENDVVGFRNYYDARNGMDIFGKRTPEMVLDKAGIEGQNYHELDDWGMDILKVGNSLGAGAIAIGIDGEIYRVGSSEEAGYRLVVQGPVRSIFELWFKGVSAGDRTYDLVHRISIYAGDHFYRASVKVEGLHGDEVLFTGIVDMHELPVFELEYAGSKILGTHGNQGYIDEVLGLGLLIPENQFIRYEAAPKNGDGVTITHMAAIQLDNETTSDYAFFSGWVFQDEQFADQEYFKSMLKKAVDRKSVV